MGEGFAFLCWVRLNFPPGFRPPVDRRLELYEFWHTGQRDKWWCWACMEYHVNVC